MTKRNKHREQLIKQHNHKYIRHYTNEGYYCFYCGDPADTLDHVPPLSVIDSMPYEQRKRFEIPAVLVPCCSECNGALGDRRLTTVQDRLNFLESYYDAFFKKQQAMWHEEEIKQLGYTLQVGVRARQERLQRYIHKIRGIQRRSLFVETHPTFEPNYLEENDTKESPPTL